MKRLTTSVSYSDAFSLRARSISSMNSLPSPAAGTAFMPPAAVALASAGADPGAGRLLRR